MTLLATSDNPHFVASRFEVDRPGITYTSETLRLLKEHYPQNVELYFITGADAIADIVRWNNSASIAENATLVGQRGPATTSTRLPVLSILPASTSM